MPDDKPQDDRPASGIKNVSVGFGPSVSARPEPVAPAPPYRVLVAGDFALGADGERQALAGRDAAELLAELSPAFEVIVDNRLGTMPASLAVPTRLDGLAALRPASLIDRFAHHRHAADAVRRGDRESLAASGQACDRLVAALPQRHEPLENQTSGESPADTGDDDDLDALFDLVDTSKDGSAREAASAAGRSLQQFIDEAIAPRAARPASSASDESARSEAAALLDEQAWALTSDMRLRQVLENWHGLRLLLQAATRRSGIEVTLVQIGPDVDAATVEALLAGENGALQEELFDLVLMAGRCAATGAGADMLKALADAADAFGSFGFATLTPDFAGVPPERLAAMDAPHQLVDGAGFETFRALRARPAAERLALFWNDVLALEAARDAPALFIPAAWIAAAMVAANIGACGWPRLRASGRAELSGFPVAPVRFQGREAAAATRVLATDDSAGGLASAGIATLCGHVDRDAVRLAHLPLFAETGSAALYGPKIGDQLVFARLTMLLQSVLPHVLAGEADADQKAAAAEQELARLSQAIAESPRFRVAAARDEDDAPVLDITATLLPGIASRQDFTFQIPL